MLLDVRALASALDSAFVVVSIRHEGNFVVTFILKRRVLFATSHDLVQVYFKLFEYAVRLPSSCGSFHAYELLGSYRLVI